MALLQWKVVEVIPEAKDTITYVLTEISGQEVQYEAGQFLTFLFDDHGHEIRRSYSMSTTPGIDATVSVTIKKKDNGIISRYILEHWTDGTVVKSLSASGRFTITTNPAQKRQVFFIAAGSGIVPIYALMKKLLHEEPHTQVVFLYQNHDENQIIYHEELEQLTARYYPRITRIDLLSAPILHDLPIQRLNNGLLEYLVNQYAKQGVQFPWYYTCGPDSFMRMVQFTLRVMGVAEDRIRKEHFTIEKVPPPAFTLDSNPRNVQVTMGDKTYRFTASFPDTILTAAQKQNIRLPYSCRGGRCSACTATCNNGNVQMSMNEVLTEEDLNNGLVLTCVGYAVTDVSLTI